VKIDEAPKEVWRHYDLWMRWKALGLQSSGVLPGPGSLEDQDERLVQAFMVFELELQEKGREK